MIFGLPGIIIENHRLVPAPEGRLPRAVADLPTLAVRCRTKSSLGETAAISALSFSNVGDESPRS